MTAGLDGVSAERDSWSTTLRCLEPDYKRFPLQALLLIKLNTGGRHPLTDICDTMLECIDSS